MCIRDRSTYALISLRKFHSRLGGPLIVLAVLGLTFAAILLLYFMHQVVQLSSVFLSLIFTSQLFALPKVIEILLNRKKKNSGEEDNIYAYCGKTFIKGWTPDELLPILQDIALRERYQVGVIKAKSLPDGVWEVETVNGNSSFTEQFTQTLIKEGATWLLVEHDETALLRLFEITADEKDSGNTKIHLYTQNTLLEYFNRSQTCHPIFLVSFAVFLNHYQEQISSIEDPLDKHDPDLSQGPLQVSGEHRYSSQCEEMLRTAKSLMRLVPENNWEFKGEKSGVTCHLRMDSSRIAMVRGEGIINVPINELHDYLSNPKTLVEYNPSIEANDLIESVASGVKIIWQKLKSAMVVSARDLIILLYNLKAEDGTFYILAQSTEYPERPPTKEAVRAILVIGAWILKRSEGNANKTRCIYIAKADLKGNVPKGIVNTVVKNQAFLMLDVEKAYWKRRKKNV
eukprot:TRINITY_DN9021_c0_g1_i27.p1 TRINITY_DN9021_c0_g1~~TRINITY_DN9021_c0_g1_i27.p1  ORF type:complete len:457 (-),score=59.98 TRINITY_DN9021_c0_g1_i27:156-1526(-)